MAGIVEGFVRVLTSNSKEGFCGVVDMAIVESVGKIPLQDPPEEEFCAADLTWTKFGNSEHHDEVPFIPYDRVDAFIIGECSNVECTTRFHIERGKKPTIGSLKDYKDDEYLEYRLYWCSFGPENYGEEAYYLVEGCTCHFVVKRLYAQPSLALIVYNERCHINKSGFICHGSLDRDAIGPTANYVHDIFVHPRREYLGETHRRNSVILWFRCKICPQARDDYQKMIKLASACGLNAIESLDFFLRILQSLTLSSWGSKQNGSCKKMIHFGHRSVVAADSTFGVNRLKYPLFTLVFYSRQHALPVAWVITRSFAKPGVSNVEPGWKVGGFLIDDTAAEIDLLSDVFCCPVLFSLWRVCRSWLRNIVKKCSNIEIQWEIFKRLGTIVYSIWGAINASLALEQFMLDFVDQTAFMEYFKVAWLPNLEMWLSTMRNFPLASQEASGALEAYHNVKEKYIASTSWHRALQIPDYAVSLDDKDHLFAKVVSQKDSSLTHIVWNPGSEFASRGSSW
ncbi:hypothetical protein HKD37_08G022581 [Glycine soja]